MESVVNFWKGHAIGCEWLKVKESKQLHGKSVVMFLMMMHLPPDVNDEYREVGTHGFDFAANHTESYEDAPEHTNLMLLLIHLWPGDWHAQIQWVNKQCNW